MLAICSAAPHKFHPILNSLKHLLNTKTEAPALINASTRTDPLNVSSYLANKREKFAVAAVTKSQRDRTSTETAGDEEINGEIQRSEPQNDEPQNYKELESNHMSSSSSIDEGFEFGRGGDAKPVTRAINAGIVLAAGTLAITKLLTIDHDYWQGWTLYEILRYAPEHNWAAYEEALKANPVFAKMVISGIVYTLGDWIAQCYEGKPLFDFDPTRMFRSGLVGFTLHGSLSHYYYQFCEALFPFQGWWVVPAKVAFDQTVWAAVWNSIYFVALGFLRLESSTNILKELKDTFGAMLTAGWKLWPFAHVITYGVIPLEQRLLWVDCVELIWVTILSTYSNEKSEARISEAQQNADSKPTLKNPEDTKL